MSLIPFAGAVQKFNRQREPAGFQIERSLRFNSADSAYLDRTPGSAPTAATKGTWSFWIKRTKLATEVYIIGSRDGGNNTATFIRIESGDTLRFYNHDGSGVTWNMITSQVFRDVGAWMHIVVALDTTQATDTNRIKIYVNGTQVTAFGTASYPAQNATMTRWAANGIPNYIGNEGTTPSNYGDYYLAETHYIDGQALTPTDFGEFNETTGVWQPIEYTGTYGTNGFYLKFADNSGTTSTTLGKDSSGNGNNWTPNNFSVTAGAGNDSLVDVPNNYGTDTGVGGEVRGNYCTLDAISPIGSASILGTISNGNLQLDHSASSYAQRFGNFVVSTGKWYFEVTITTLSSNDSSAYGISKTAAYPAGTGTPGSFTGCVAYGDFGDSYLRPITESSGVSDVSGVASMNFAVNDVIMVAFDVSAGKFWMGKNGTWFDSGNPAAGTNEKQTFTANIDWKPWVVQWGNSASQSFINFGQRPFAYTAPSGFKALCTQNLPEPTIVDGSEYFNTVTYTGTLTDGQGTGATQSITGVGFQPDFLWLKNRTNANQHLLVDAVRTVTNYRYLNSSDTGAETTVNSNGAISALNADGFTVENGNDSSAKANLVGRDGWNYVAWNWKANGAGVTNNNGTITSTVSVNTTSGVSIGIFTGTGSNATVGHGLGVAAAMVIVKNRTSGSSDDWAVWHRSLTSGAYYLRLNDTAGEAVAATYWNSTIPTSTVFSVGSSFNTNKSANNYVFYVFAPVAGYSAFGSYTGNGSTDGPFVFTGFRPSYILIKRIDGVADWVIYDAARSPYNVANKQLSANQGLSESTADPIDFLSQGVKLRAASPNANGGTYIYIAFAENPFKYSLAR